MNQLTLTSQSLTMSSREIAELTGKEHSDVMRDIRIQFAELYDIEKDDADLHDKLKQYLNIEFDNRGYMSIVNLDKEQTYTLIAGYNVKLRNAIIKRWQELESKQQFTIPQTYGEALLECGRLAIEVETQAKQLEQQKPQVEFANDVANTCDSISIGGYAGLLASSGYDIGQNRLFAWLREKGYLTTRKNRPSIQAIDSGWFKWIETTYICPRTGLPKVSGQPTITGKGQIYLRKKLIKELGGK